MSSIIRLSLIAVLGAVGVLATAPPLPAQYMGGGFRGPVFRPTMPMNAPMFGPMYAPMTSTGGFSTRGFQPIPSSLFSGLPPLQPVRPLPAVNGFNPLMFNPLNRNYNPSYSAATTYYYLNQYGQSGYSSPYVLPGAALSAYPGAYPTGGSQSTYATFSRAQQEAGTALGQTRPAAQKAADDRRPDEPRVVAGAPGAPPAQDATALTRAMAETDPAALATGDAMNQILAAVIAAQENGSKADSAFLPPNLMAEVRFAGGPNAAAVNLLRPAGGPQIPTAFDNGQLAALRPALGQALAAVVAPVQAGKPAEAAKVTALEAVVKKTEAALPLPIKDVNFVDAVAARAFVNQLKETVTVLRTPAAAGLVDPRWASEGTSVADLVKQMAKFKLKFGPARKEGEEAYVALHRGLAAYLFALGQNVQPKK